MRRLMHVSVLLPVLLLASCGGEGDSRAYPNSELGREYLIGYGESIHVGALVLEFTTLAEDSRCPMNASCVWAGNARILVTATRGRSTTVVELNTYSGYPVRATFEGYLVELRRLQPDIPWAPRGPLEEYTATVFVDGASH